MKSLVVDDDIVNRKLLQSILKNFGECHLASNGKEAIAAFESALVSGASIWVDNLCIPRDSRNKEGAELFINFVLDPQVSAAIANYLWYANCNKAAAEFTSKEIINDPLIYPAPAVLNRCEFFRDIGSDTEIGRGHGIRNKIWSELLKK